MEPAFRKSSVEEVYGETFSEAHAITLLYHGSDAFHTISDVISNAQHLICLQFYIFRNDETGTEIARLLKTKAQEGVRVYILYDHFGSFGTPRAFWKDLRSSGIHIRATRPFKWSSPFHYIRRDHRKLIVIDGIKAFTGGLNLANEYRGFHVRLHKRAWRDTGIVLEGPIAQKLFETFDRTWQVWGGDPIPLTVLPYAPGTDRQDTMLPVIPIVASSSKGRRRMRKLLYHSISHSDKSISFTTAYFTPSRRMLYALEEAVKRGVRVSLLLPGVSDVPAAHYAGRASFTRLLKAGVKIFNYQGEVLHAKSYVFDGCWSIVGSANLDFQSLRWNDEGNVGILDEGFGMKMIEMFNEDTQHSIEIDESVWSRRNLWERLKEKFFALFRMRL